VSPPPPPPPLVPHCRRCALFVPGCRYVPEGMQAPDFCSFYPPCTTKASPCTECNFAAGVSFGRGVFTFKTGQWNKIRMTIGLNTPNVTDGLVEIKFNDQVVLSYNKVNWRQKDGEASGRRLGGVLARCSTARRFAAVGLAPAWLRRLGPSSWMAVLPSDLLSSSAGVQPRLRAWSFLLGTAAATPPGRPPPPPTPSSRASSSGAGTRRWRRRPLPRAPPRWQRRSRRCRRWKRSSADRKGGGRPPHSLGITHSC